MSLTDLKVRNAKAKGRPYKLFDERGLYLLITPTGSKCWRFKYRFMQKEKLLAIGMYPEVSLSEAREKRDEAGKKLTNDIDPGVAKQIFKQAEKALTENSFEAVAREWFAKYSSAWVKSHSSKIISRLERDIFPWIGQNLISAITPPELLKILRRVEARGALDTAHRAHQESQ